MPDLVYVSAISPEALYSNPYIDSRFIATKHFELVEQIVTALSWCVCKAKSPTSCLKQYSIHCSAAAQQKYSAAAYVYTGKVAQQQSHVKQKYC